MTRIRKLGQAVVEILFDQSTIMSERPAITVRSAATMLVSVAGRQGKLRLLLNTENCHRESAALLKELGAEQARGVLNLERVAVVGAESEAFMRNSVRVRTESLQQTQIKDFSSSSRPSAFAWLVAE